MTIWRPLRPPYLSCEPKLYVAHSLEFSSFQVEVVIRHLLRLMAYDVSDDLSGKPRCDDLRVEEVPEEWKVRLRLS